MWWCRAAILSLVVFASGACGFEPLYGGGERGPVRAEFNAVQVGPIADREGQQLRNELLDLISPYGSPDLPDYRLDVTTEEYKSGLAVKKSEFATRANLTMRASFFLREIETSRVLFSGSSSVVAGYNILDSAYATLIAEKDARERAITQVAREIQIRLAAYFRLRDQQPAVSARP